MSYSQIVLLILLAGSFLLVLPFELASRKRVEVYWKRACQGARWKRRFPHVQGAEIRRFLTVFVEAFAFANERRLCFSPDDKVLDVYHTLYPPGGGWADNLELETLVMELQKACSIDLVPFWREDITLGELFILAHSLRT